ncbi:MAG: hypothetical protein U1A27_06600 [Phycisphaerae bacterium]
MAASGKLQEYEQDGQVLYKIEDVERIVANEGSSIVDLAISENEPRPGEIADLSVPEPTSDINLLGLDESSIDLDLGPSPAIEPKPPAAAPKPPAAPAKPAGKPAKPGSGALPVADGSSSSINLSDSSDLSLSRDIGLSASDVIALDESAEKPADSKAATRITAPGMSVLDDADAARDVDPLGKTRITTGPEEDLAMAQVGSGSGLLDLTRESDDTSLGAELLDVISPSEGTDTETAAEPVDSDTGTIEAEVVETAAGDTYGETEAASSDSAAAVAELPAGAAPALVGAAAYESYAFDPLAPAFTGLAVIALASLTLVGIAATSQIQGVWPGFMRLIDSGMNLWIFAAALVLLGGVSFAVGLMVGKPAGPAKSKAAKPAKPAPAKDKKKKK